MTQSLCLSSLSRKIIAWAKKLGGVWIPIERGQTTVYLISTHQGPDEVVWRCECHFMK